MSEVSISMPRFTVSANDNLNGDLEAMGIRDAFENADFSGISPTPLALQQVQQRAFVEVNEQGTVAAAATGGAAQATAAPPGITLDHPFLFIVRDTTTGTILFDAEVENPSSS
jgi:serpin B